MFSVAPASASMLLGPDAAVHRDHRFQRRLLVGHHCFFYLDIVRSDERRDQLDGTIKPGPCDRRGDYNCNLRRLVGTATVTVTSSIQHIILIIRKLFHGNCNFAVRQVLKFLKNACSLVMRFEAKVA